MGREDLSTPLDSALIASRRDEAQAWFKDLRDRICAAFEAIEDDYCATHPEQGSPGRFEQKQWNRPEGGGGVMSVMHGQVFEKVGVNISTVHGEFSPEFRGQIPGTSEDPSFWASGISLVAHMRNPFVPAVHMNTRYLNAGGDAGKRWFGGGADLTPIIPNDDDIKDFHQELETTCGRHHPDYYKDFKAWCDDYFYLKHRDEPGRRIFYDYLDAGDYDGNPSPVMLVSILTVYPHWCRRRNALPIKIDIINCASWLPRGVQLYDRGTTFGLKTGGIEANNVHAA